jgi:hypothetical protein
MSLVVTRLRQAPPSMSARSLEGFRDTSVCERANAHGTGSAGIVGCRTSVRRASRYRPHAVPVHHTSGSATNQQSPE